MMLIKRQRECASFTGSSMSTAGVLALSATAADLCTHSRLVLSKQLQADTGAPLS